MYKILLMTLITVSIAFSNEYSTGPFKETVKRISDSSRIYVITNANAQLSPGDYISVIYNDELSARGIVAKNSGNLVGVKVIKIYSLASWKQINKNSNVLILKGDDSAYMKANENLDEEAKALDAKAQNLDDDQIFDEKIVLDEGIEVKEEVKRKISNDNILGASWGFIEALNTSGETTREEHIMIKWAYQVKKDTWTEVVMGKSTLSDYPQVDSNTKSNGLVTSLTSFTFRLKYTLNLPYYSYFMPYLGYQVISASSDDAGSEALGNTDDQNTELEQVSNLEKNQFVIGATFLKRLVPAWFIVLDLGLDTASLGLSLEF